MKGSTLYLYNFVCLFYYTKELETGQLFRLIVKLGVINEQPEYVTIRPSHAFCEYCVVICDIGLLLMLAGVRRVTDIF